MKKINLLLVFLMISFACMGQEESIETISEPMPTSGYTSFGEQINANEAMNVQEMSAAYLKMAIADTVQTKFNAIVTDVCQSKGCWMKLQLESGEETMVRFKDYGFFVPKNIAGKEVVVNGVAFVEEMSVEDQKHYAKDAGKSEEEIAKITETKKAYGFEADGVLLKD
ncbi:FIG00552520: hypothetical protein [hydrothermal vent metagenome]|uniref:DUF4920 domain-containing protein n=1 Tax=hydrothermal vent metagenome TaxID=652676 RepID=A0A3B0SXE2_9ZZZZ